MMIKAVMHRCNATIHETGNGFPVEGDYVPGEGLLWRIEHIDGRIYAGASGEANYVYARVVEADWGDCDEEDEFPARVSTAPGEEAEDTEDVRRADHELDRLKYETAEGRDR